MVVSVINLFFREDRMSHFQQQAKEQGFDYIRFEAIHNEKNPKEGITQSHKAVVRKAKEDGLPMCIVAEDDIKFFGKDKGAFDYFIANTPPSFDFYSAVIFVGDINENNRVVSQFSGGTSLYIISEKFYNFFLSLPDNAHVDREVSSHCKDFEFYVCPKVVCTQIGGMSNNRNIVVEGYDIYLENKQLYQ